ncbi:Bud site selection protein, Revert to axial protein 1 [Coemansia sp. S16]|nr:Bud site selection protein, Revert to axial protein 1 [Coemansia sp. S680]KAJ2054260.1 Bud site selection protein, Revert to axial protein 1 [Coemansia sp. S16]KAJ2057829.1 Bud site selection protein, Revert to axial protein 1 [Coemansia sp. S155-1]KAJ2099136.1 Bud site selection protein, Revert to axial protein 1 [Coemansia sp. S100]
MNFPAEKKPGYQEDPNHPMYHIPLPSNHAAFDRRSEGDHRGRSLSSAQSALARRSSDDDRTPMTTFFGTQAWQRMSSGLPTGVRDPLNIDELEREERQMPFTQMAVGAMTDEEALSAATTGAADGGATPIDWAYMQDHNLRTGGLPSLDQVLTRRTRAPLALRDFAVHCSVRQPQARRWLEFYMAARTHEKMCLAYESDLRHAKARSHYASHDSYVLPAQDPDELMDPASRAAAHNATMESLSRGRSESLGKAGFRRSHRQSSRMAVQIQTAAETIFLRYFRAALDPNLMQTGGGFRTAGNNKKIGSLRRMLTQKPGERPTLDDAYHQGYGVASESVYVSAVATHPRDPSHDGLASPTSLVMSHDHLHTPITDKPTTQQQRYLRLPHGGAGAARNHLYYHMPWPPEILTDIEQRLLHDGSALDATLFSEALLYAYDVLDTYYFPIFIADAVSRNVTRDHCVLRVLVAFVFLWLGFALPLALILLDEEPKARRVWAVLPLLLGWWNVAVGFGGCDLLLAAVRKYQSPGVRDSTQKSDGWSVKSQFGGWRRAWFSTRVSVDMTATRMVRARSIRWFIGALVMTAISTAILCAVPGTKIYTD